MYAFGKFDKDTALGNSIGTLPAVRGRAVNVCFDVVQEIV